MKAQVKWAFIFAALSAAFAVPATDDARAQNVAADLLPPHEVSTVIASMGMRPLSRPVWRGDRYVVFAIDRYGQEVRVVLDAHNGQVLAVRPSMRGFAQGHAVPPYGYDQGYAPPPPAGYPPATGRAPYDPRYGTPPVPPGAVPGAPPSDEDYFDNDRQQGSLPPLAGSRTASRDMALRDLPTGSVPRRVTAVAPKDKSAKDATPMPRPRPELAKANDPRANDPGSVSSKPVTAPSQNAGQPQVAAKDANKPAGNNDVRVIDMSKPKPEAQAAEPKPGEAIRF